MPSICVFTGWPRVNNEELGGSSILCKEVDMSAAVQEVKEGKLKLRVAARAYGLPLGSLKSLVMGAVKSNFYLHVF